MPMRKISIVLAFSILFASVLLVPHTKADVGSIPYDNIGTEWSIDPFLVKDGASWDCRTWHWSAGPSWLLPSILEIAHEDGSNYVRWNSDGLVMSSALDTEWGSPWCASKVD